MPVHVHVHTFNPFEENTYILVADNNDCIIIDPGCYDAGEQGILELLDAYRTTSATRIRQAELDAAVREAEIELEFVSGWEIP